MSARLSAYGSSQMGRVSPKTLRAFCAQKQSLVVGCLFVLDKTGKVQGRLLHVGPRLWTPPTPFALDLHLILDKGAQTRVRRSCHALSYRGARWWGGASREAVLI